MELGSVTIHGIEYDFEDLVKQDVEKIDQTLKQISSDVSLEVKKIQKRSFLEV